MKPVPRVARLASAPIHIEPAMKRTSIAIAPSPTAGAVWLARIWSMWSASESEVIGVLQVLSEFAIANEEGSKPP